MRWLRAVAAFPLAALAACGLENAFSAAPHSDFARPASAVRGQLPWTGVKPSLITATDGDGNPLTPFQVTVSGNTYDLRLPSTKYGFVIVAAQKGDAQVLGLVPGIGEETAVQLDLDARSSLEVLIFRSRLTHDGLAAKQLTPSAYAGNGTTTGTRLLVQRTLSQDANAQALLQMAQRLFAKANPDVSGDPGFFRLPEYDSTWVVKTRAVDPSWIARNQVDYTGDGKVDNDSVVFDQTLATVAGTPSLDPSGCADPNNVRVVFASDFAGNGKDGNGNTANRFKWATDKPGKSMFFVGWVHKDSPFPDPDANNRLGGSVPNSIPMYDDGTNGDEVGGDGVWSVTIDLPRNLRIGYKYTWGTRGAVWTGSEEWPGNSRLLEIVDVNGDNIVYRRDVFGDEATSKDNANQFNGPANTSGSITWTTDLHGCGPESHEQPVFDADASQCKKGAWFTPKAVGPLKVACAVP